MLSVRSLKFATVIATCGIAITQQSAAAQPSLTSLHAPTSSSSIPTAMSHHYAISRQYSTSFDPKNWMAEFSTFRFRDLVVPGSHNSAAHAVADSLPSFLTRWTLNQDLSIFEQLESGVRFLDIRLTYREDELWTAHRYHCISFRQVSEDVLRFIDEHPSEVVALRLVADHHMDDSIKHLFDRTNPESRDKIAPFLAPLENVAVEARYRHLTLKEMTQRLKKNVILIEGTGRMAMNGGMLWPSREVATKWHETPYSTDLCVGVSTDSSWIRQGVLLLYQMHITPDAESLVDGGVSQVYGDLRAASEHVNNDITIPWLRRMDAETFRGVISHDFIGADASLFTTILQINRKKLPTLQVEEYEGVLEENEQMKISGEKAEEGDPVSTPTVSDVCSGRSSSCFQDKHCKSLGPDYVCDTTWNASTQYKCILSSSSIASFSPESSSSSSSQEESNILPSRKGDRLFQEVLFSPTRGALPARLSLSGKASERTEGRDEEGSVDGGSEDGGEREKDQGNDDMRQFRLREGRPSLPTPIGVLPKLRRAH